MATEKVPKGRVTLGGELMPKLEHLYRTVETIRENIDVNHKRINEYPNSVMGNSITLAWFTEDRDEAELIAGLLETKTIKPGWGETADGVYRVTVKLKKGTKVPTTEK